MSSTIDAIIAQGPRPVEIATPQQTMAQTLTLRQAMQGQQMGQQQIQAAQLENQQRQIQMDQTRSINAAYQAALTTDADGNPTIDRNMLNTAVSRSGYGSQLPAINKALDDLESSHIALKKQKSDLALQENNTGGSIGAAAKAAGYDPDFLEMTLRDAERKGAYSAGMADPILAKLQQARQQDPSGAAAKAFAQKIANQLISLSPEQTKLGNETATAAAATTTANARVLTAQTGQQKNQRETDAAYLQRVGGAQSQDQLDQLRQGAKAAGVSDAAIAQIPGMYSPAAIESLNQSNMNADQRATTSQARTNQIETARHNQADETAATTRNNIAGGELNLNQKKFDATIGAGLDANGQPISDEAMKAMALKDPVAVAMANYQAPPPNTRNALGQATLRKVMAINPDYHAEYFQTFQKTENNATNGQIATSANALNTMMGHLGVLNRAVDALDNSNLPVLNKLANAIGVQTGKDPVTVYRTIVHRLGPEVTKAYVAGGGTEGERGTNQQDFADSLGNNQLKANVGISAYLADSKIKALQDQYNRGTYGRGKQKLISDEAEQARQTLLKQAPADVRGDGASAAPPLPPKLQQSDVGKTFTNKAGKRITVTAVNPSYATQFKFDEAK